MGYTYVLAIGSNLIDCKTSTVKQAISFIRASATGQVKASSVYETQAVNGKAITYANAVVQLRSDLPPKVMELKCKELESRFGRIRPSLIVALDVDVIMVDGQIIKPKDAAHSYFRIGASEIGIDHEH